MPSVRQSKKTEVVEVRVAHDLKSAFVERCRLDQVTVSEAVRRLMEERMTTPVPGGASRGRLRIVAAGLLGAALGIGIAAPSFAHEAAAARPTFQQLDRNGDGVLTRAEYR